jgi:two-component system nitrogen regulation sensor histidine kinase NtrY
MSSSGRRHLYTDRLAGVELRLLLDDALPPAMLDAEQMKRVFVNLIDNALEALADLTDERRVTISTRQDSNRDLILATVEDTGEGFR